MKCMQQAVCARFVRELYNDLYGVFRFRKKKNAFLLLSVFATLPKLLLTVRVSNYGNKPTPFKSVMPHIRGIALRGE